MQQLSLKANGKLLLTAEYAVLSGATALALPTSLGQKFQFSTNNNDSVQWNSLDHEGNYWMKMKYDLNKLEASGKNDFVYMALKLATEKHGKVAGFNARCELEFPNNWGLGSSSTFIYAISKWLDIDPYLLLSKTLGGSGYDIACADANSSIFFQIDPKSRQIHIDDAAFNPSFKERLYFVYLNKKQVSKDEVKRYLSLNQPSTADIAAITSITRFICKTDSLAEFNQLIDEHEFIISKIIQQQRVKQSFFNDFKGSIKSLGAWGGDFILVSNTEDENYINNYFKSKGFETIIPYSKLILEHVI